MRTPHSVLTLVFAVAGMGTIRQPEALANETILKCPNIMAHTVERANPGWSIYRNMPFRLTGADVAYVVDQHYEATLEPDLVNRLNDDNLSTAQVFQLTKHRDAKNLPSLCHYGVNAKLSKAISGNMSECVVVQHGRFDETIKGEFVASCK